MDKYANKHVLHEDIMFRTIANYCTSHIQRLALRQCHLSYGSDLIFYEFPARVVLCILLVTVTGIMQCSPRVCDYQYFSYLKTYCHMTDADNHSLKLMCVPHKVSPNRGVLLPWPRLGTPCIIYRVFPGHVSNCKTCRTKAISMAPCLKRLEGVDEWRVRQTIIWRLTHVPEYDKMRNLQQWKLSVVIRAPFS